MLARGSLAAERCEGELAAAAAAGDELLHHDRFGRDEKTRLVVAGRQASAYRRRATPWRGEAVELFLDRRLENDRKLALERRQFGAIPQERMFGDSSIPAVCASGPSASLSGPANDVPRRRRHREDVPKLACRRARRPQRYGRLSGKAPTPRALPRAQSSEAPQAGVLRGGRSQHSVVHSGKLSRDAPPAPREPRPECRDGRDCEPARGRDSHRRSRSHRHLRPDPSRDETPGRWRGNDRVHRCSRARRSTPRARPAQPAVQRSASAAQSSSGGNPGK